jgi:hypothetical protein
MVAVLTIVMGSVAVFAAEATLTQSVSDGVETITLQMTLESVRGSNFEVLVQNSLGSYDSHTPAEVSTYIGTVDEYPGAIAAGILKSNGDLWTKVYFDRGYTWFTLGSSKYGERGDYPAYLHMPTMDNVTSGHAGTTTYLWDQGIDISYRHFNQYAGNDAATCLEQVEFMAMQLKAIYLRDALIIPGLARVVMRGSQAHCPYYDFQDNSRLTILKNEWETNHTDADRDAVAMSSPTVGGGVAFWKTIATANAYTINGAWPGGEFDVVARHEIGHNWGVLDMHANAPEGHTINCGNAFGRFSGPEVEAILDERDAKLAYLDSQGTYSTIDVPPYAALDTATVQVETGSITIDVLLNDHDANADTISISAFDPLSANGNAVTLSSGTGPGGRDELTYTLGNEIGMDSFYYTIIDDSTLEQTATGLVLIYTDQDNTLKGYWTLNETSATTAKDKTVYGNNGTLLGDMTFDVDSVTGPFGNALNFDGTDDYVSISGLAIEGNALTMTAWVKRDGPQAQYSGLVMSRGSAHAGLEVLSTNNELTYLWNNIWGFNSGLYLPDNQWTFVAMVVEPGKTILYMDDGTLQSAVNPTTHISQAITSAHLGVDTSWNYFKGSIDDVRIYDYSLSQAEIEAIAAGGKACSPIPYDGATRVDSGLFQWVSGAAATSYDFYIGTNQAAVTNATKALPEYKGLTYTAYYTTELETSKTYYWRVDTITAGQTLTGDIWRLTTAGTMEDYVPFVANGDFEDRSGYGQYYGSPNWTWMMEWGGWCAVEYNPTIFTNDADGNTSGTYLLIQGPSQGEAVSDVVISTIQTGTEITAAVKVGRPKTGYSQQPNDYGLEILIDGVVVASTGPKDIIIDLGAAADSWVALDLTYTALTADAGKELKVKVVNYNGTQSFYDNVTVNLVQPTSTGDLDRDGDVDLVDLNTLQSEYLLQEGHTESSGIVVLEAEHYAENTPGSGSMAGSNWTQMSGSGSIGDGFIQALPDQGRSINSNLKTYSPHLSYPIYFSTTGDYYLWIRGMAADSNADSVHYGADGVALSFDYNSAVAFPIFAGFSWVSNRGDGARPVINVDSPGMHTLDLWMREDGTALDRFALSTDVNYNPNSGGEPTESVYQALTYDLNADGIMNLADYARLASNWLAGVD